MRVNTLMAKAPRATLAVAAAAVLVTALAVCPATAGAATMPTPATPVSVLHNGLQRAVNDGQPGAIGMTYVDGQASYTGVGFSQPLLRRPVDPQSSFRVGSNTKAFVATVLLQLEAEGKLSLDDTVEHWLPGVVDTNGYDGSKITIRDLLEMRSNIPEYLTPNWPIIGLPYILDLTPYLAWTPRQLVDIALLQKPTSTNPPGTTYYYSNTNYILAGMVIKAVTGKSAAAEITQRIIRPLGLTRTYFPVSNPSMGGNYLHGFFYFRDVSTSNVYVTGAAGAMVSTLNDLGRFNRALFSGQLLAPAQQAELTDALPTGTPGASFGLGVAQVTTSCGKAWFYNGEVLGYFSTVMTSLDGTRQVVAATNEANLLSEGQGLIDQMNAATAAFCTP